MFDHEILCVLAIAMCTAAWAIALAHTAQRSRRPRFPLSKAEQRASTLLKEWLTREQRIQYEQQGYFDVLGSETRTRYRIRYSPQMNVDQLDKQGRRVAVLCFLPETHLPVCDVMLSQKIMLENDEVAALSVANRRYC